MPAAVAAGLPETTTPWLPVATLVPRVLTGVLVACGEAKGASKRSEDNIEMILRIGCPWNVFPEVIESSCKLLKSRRAQLRASPEREFPLRGISPCRVEDRRREGRFRPRKGHS